MEFIIPNRKNDKAGSRRIDRRLQSQQEIRKEALYLIFDSECVKTCSNPTSRMAFVDDVNLLVCGDSTAENCRRLERVHEECTWSKRS